MPCRFVVAGFGLDALLKRRPLRWPVLVLGSVLWVVFVVMAIAFTNTRERPFDAPGVNLPITVGGYLWALLFAAFPTAWLLQRRSSALPKVVAEPEGHPD